MKLTEFKKLIREEVRKVVKEISTATRQPGFKGRDMNDYQLTVLAGPFNTLGKTTATIKAKYPKAVDMLRDSEFMEMLGDVDPTDVGGFYIVKGPSYGGSGYSIINGEDIEA